MTTEQRDQLYKAAIGVPRTVEAPVDLGDAIFREIVTTPQQRGLLAPGWLGGASRRTATLLLLGLLLVLGLTVTLLVLSHRQPRPLLLSMYHGGPERTGVMAGPGPAGVPSILWDVQRPGPIPFTTMPLVQDGRVLVADGSGKVVALDAGTGTKVWESALDSPARGTPVVVDGLLVLGTDGGQVIALRVADGTRAWTTSLGTAAISASLVEADGRVYAAGEDGTVSAVDARTGVVAWAVPVSGPILHGPALSAGVLYVGDETGRLVAIDVSSRSILWHVALGPGGVATPTVANGSLYVSRGLLTTQGDLLLLDPRDGSNRWTFDTPDHALVYAGAVTDSTLFAVSDNGTVAAVDLATQRARWTNTADGPLGTLGAEVDGVFYASSNAHTVFAFDDASGTRLWKIAVTGSPTQPAVVGGRVFVGTTLGHVVAMGGAPVGSSAPPSR